MVKDDETAIKPELNVKHARTDHKITILYQLPVEHAILTITQI